MMQVQSRMDLDNRVNNENVNANIKINKNVKNNQKSKPKKRAFGKDLTNKSKASTPINVDSVGKKKGFCLKKINKREDSTAKKEKENEATMKEIKSSKEMAPWDVRLANNDQFVTDYVEDIMASLREDEMLNRGGCVIDNEYDFMGAQKDLNYRMRAVLVDWLIAVHRKFKLSPATYFLAINLMDRYLAKKQLNRKKLQLTGCCCLWIASKYHEIYAPEMDDFIYISDSAFDDAELIETEIEILKTLGFTLTVPTVLSFAERYTKIAAHYLHKQREMKIISDLIMFLVESSILNYSLCRKHPSLVAAASFVYSCMATKVFSTARFEKDGLHKVIGYDFEQLMPTLLEIDSMLRSIKKTKQKAVHRKYCSATYSNIGKIDFNKLNRKFLE